MDISLQKTAPSEPLRKVLNKLSTLKHLLDGEHFKHTGCISAADAYTSMGYNNFHGPMASIWRSALCFKLADEASSKRIKFTETGLAAIFGETDIQLLRNIFLTPPLFADLDKKFSPHARLTLSSVREALDQFDWPPCVISSRASAYFYSRQFIKEKEAHLSLIKPKE